jgi:hypothetical protein
MKPTGEVVLKGESMGEFREIGSKRVYQCAVKKVDLADDVRTELQVK